jgi:ATP-dependent helicase/nuclease subunit B
MSVTDFDVFLRSPARWYLERYLRLNDVGEPPREMNAMVYGSFAHAVLEAFGRDPETASLHDEAAIADALRALTRAQLEATFGGSPPAAVAVQAALLEHRFAMYAPHEARRRRDGWRIAHVEWSSGDADTSPTFDVDGEPMALRGKVDRIERRDDGSWALIDFKTGAVRDAEKSHRRRGRWVRLQLPLYGVLTREFAAAEGLDVDRVEFAYGGLPTKMGEAAWSVAPWDATDLAEAQDAACDVVRRIRSIAPGDTIELGDDPPTDGALGFMTGERFEGGPAILDEESVSDEAAAAGEVA